MFSRILVPVDGSKQSDKSMLIALDLAIRYESYLELIHVTQISEEMINKSVEVDDMYPPSTSIMKDKIINDYYLHIIEQLRDMLKKQYEKAKKVAPNLEISTQLLGGNPGDAIVNRSKVGKFDLIVMGSSGAGLRRQILGSTSSRVVNDSKIPVLVVI